MKRSTVLKLASLVLALSVAVLPQQGLAQAKAKFTARIGHLEAPTQPRHQGLLLGAVLGAALGHVDVLVPLEERRARPEERVLAGAVEKLEVGRVGAHPTSYGTRARRGARLRTVLTPVKETGLAGARLALVP